MLAAITLALALLLVTAVLAVAIVLAASGGGDQAGATKSVRVTIHVPDGISFQGYTSTSWTAAADDGSGGPADITAWVVCAAP